MWTWRFDGPGSWPCLVDSALSDLRSVRKRHGRTRRFFRDNPGLRVTLSLAQRIFNPTQSPILRTGPGQGPPLDGAEPKVGNILFFSTFPVYNILIN